MARQEIEQTIDGVEFKYRHLPARDAVRLQSRLLRALGSDASSLSRILGAKEPSPSDILGLLGGIPEEDALSIIDMVGRESSIRPEGGDAWLVMQPNVVDAQLAGKPKLLWMWVAAGVKFQLADFFGGKPSA